MNRFGAGILVVALLVAGCSQSDGDGGRAVSQPTTEELSWFVQKVIDLERLQAFLHPETPGREVLCVAGPGLSREMSLSKDDQMVKAILSEDECENRIVFDVIEIEEKVALLSCRYPIEGVRCTVAFHRAESGWQVVAVDLYEE